MPLDKIVRLDAYINESSNILLPFPQVNDRINPLHG
jgi:hypothetical protein